jgi:enoyl-CoA hydratase/carnithine racemase
MQQFTVENVTENIRRVTFANPPVNLLDADAITEISELVDLLSGDDQVKVVIFDSSVPGYFLNHADGEDFHRLLTMTGDSGNPIFIDLTTRLAAAPFVSIAAIRGRTRGGGAEITSAFDLRYASREEAIFGQPEVAVGLITGGGAGERLPRLLGRDRTLEVLLTGQDYDADRAERYGWVTRAVPDAELDDFVGAVAARIAAFDRQAIAAAKVQVNRGTLPPEADLLASSTEFFQAVTWPGFRARQPAIGRLTAEVGVEEFERNLGDYLGAAGRA